MKKLNVGCGRDYRPGWINIDLSKDVKAEHYLDIRKDPLPVSDGECVEIYISGVLEQIGDNDHFIFALNECHRALGKGGRLNVIVPNAKYAIAHRDPMDVRKFTIETFHYFDRNCYEYRDYGSVYGFLPWSDVAVKENERHILTITMTKVEA